MATGDWSVEIERVSKRFGDVLAVDDVSLSLARGEFFSLLGPSGCGKTTLLRMVGGFEVPTAGTIRVGGADMAEVPVHRRPTNMVFQHYALFPHLTVAENVSFGFRYRRYPREQQARRIADALGLVRLAGYEGRYPSQLSGGQRQRVALARALALEPQVLLLDEPLGALDQKLRKEMQVELKGLQRTLGITFVFVTHDQEEALTMSDRLAVMNAGRVEQVDGAARVFEQPLTDFVAEFMGAANFLWATVADVGDGELSLALGGQGSFAVPLPAGRRAPRVGERVRFVVRPEKLDLRGRDLSARGIPSLSVTVEDRVYQGASTVWVVVAEGGERLLVLEQNDRPFEQRGRFAVADTAYACWDPRHTVLLAGEADAARPAGDPTGTAVSG